MNRSALAILGTQNNYPSPSGRSTMQWLQTLFSKKNSRRGIVGISFLPHGISIAVANTTQNNSVNLNHCEFIAVEKMEDYVTILKRWVIRHELGDYACHLVLDINDYQRVNIEAPNVPVNEMCMAIRWKIHELINFPIDDAVTDYYHVPDFSEGVPSLEVIACPKATVTPLIEQCTQGGLSLEVIDIQETTLRNLAALLPNNPLGVALLYLQPLSGIILIQKQGVIYMARKIAIGYEQLDAENSFSSDILGAMEHDTLLLESRSFGDDTPAILRVHDSLALEIHRSLDYVESYYNIGSVTELAIIPWAGETRDLVDKLNIFYGITAYPMDLAILLDCDLALDYATQSLCAPVIGATLRNTLATA
jgi:MSHA biogenesis protein MshI